ncbi:MAG: DNA gyrase subunit A [Nanoarchaeota archaeon]|nr:DNA gyrase subunit A [Nanoarchaeota archaeon]
MDENQPEKSTETNQENKPRQSIIPRIIEDEMRQSYVDYAMSVIVGRALPDVRDGLKPVHRRILFAMYDMGMLHNKPFKKSARIVGEVLGKYHPHGDSAVYDSMVRMTQVFSLRYPLVAGQGNFGSIDGDSPAAMRYTEARLNKLSEELLVDIDKETVAMTDNFDGSLKEPTVLPCKFPNLLLNGSSGIAVGMATNIPPHNMNEIVDGLIHMIDDPDISISELMEHITAPDFPTGALICGRSGIVSAYNSGRGILKVRAKTHVEEHKNHNRIIVDETPYMVNKAEMIKEMADLVHDKKIDGISDLRDESDREGMRVVIELKSGTDPDVLLNQLFKHSRMQVTFGVIMLGLVDNEPHVLNLKQMLYHFIEHRKDVVRKRTEFDLKAAQEREHILRGLVIALDNIDEAIRIIKQSKAVAEARQGLISSFSLSEKQANAILDMKLQKITSLEQGKIRLELEELAKLIEKLVAILADEKKVLEIIKNELVEIKDKYGDARRTQVIEGEANDIDMEDLIKPEDMVITITHSEYIKRVPVETYKQQKRGGKGVIATGTKEEDFVEDIFVANTHSYILFFTNKGKVYWLKVYNLPEGSRTSKGKPIINLLQLDSDEKVSTYVPVKEFDDVHYIMMVTKKGTVKKTNLSEFSRPRNSGIIACSLDEGDELINVTLTDGKKDVIIATKLGMAIRFNEDKVRAMGRNAGGVRGITLKGEDDVIDMVVASEDKSLLTVTRNGYGKRTPISEYRETNRGGMGVKNIICSERNGPVRAVKSVGEEDDVMMISKDGICIRTPVSGLSLIGRATQGVTLMKLGEGDELVAAAKIINE